MILLITTFITDSPTKPHLHRRRHDPVKRHNETRGIRAQNHPLMQFNSPIQPERELLQKLNAPNRKSIIMCNLYKFYF